MAEVKFSKGSEEWLIFMDFWNLCQEYWNPENNDNYWDSMVNSVDEFYKKYADIELSKELALSFIRAQEVKFTTKGANNG